MTYKDTAINHIHFQGPGWTTLDTAWTRVNEHLIEAARAEGFDVGCPNPLSGFETHAAILRCIEQDPNALERILDRADALNQASMFVEKQEMDERIFRSMPWIRRLWVTFWRLLGNWTVNYKRK